jgi:hypothetical protein
MQIIQNESNLNKTMRSVLRFLKLHCNVLLMDAMLTYSVAIVGSSRFRLATICKDLASETPQRNARKWASPSSTAV